MNHHDANVDGRAAGNSAADPAGDPLDGMLSEYLRQQLGPQLGRAMQAFAAEDSAPARRKYSGSPRLTRRVLLWGVPLGGAIAAAVAVTLAMPYWRHEAAPMIAPPAAPIIAPGSPSAHANPSASESVAINDHSSAGTNSPTADPFPFAPPPGVSLTEAVNVRDIDDGVVLVDGKVPMRQVRRQTWQRVTWFDQRYQADVEMDVPREQIVLVAVNPF